MIEIQVHPSDIRRRVRYLFFGRRAVLGLIAGGAGLFLFVMFSMVSAPTVIRQLYKTNFLFVMRQERAVQHERLRQHVDQITTLERSLDEQRVKVEKLIAVYGLDDGPLGKGGITLPLHRPVGDGSMIELADAQRRRVQLERALAQLEHQIELLAQFEKDNADIVSHTPSILPLPADRFVLTSPFGSRINPFTRVGDFHRGLDLAAPTGTPVFAAADGVVTFAGRVPLRQSVSWWRFGNVVVVRHSDHFITIYGHCDTVEVRTGQAVIQGQTVATVGSTGWSTNSHLHYEVRSDLERPGTFDPIDPRIYILNYQWNNEAQLLSAARASRDYRNFDPVPSAFVGRRRE